MHVITLEGFDKLLYLLQSKSAVLQTHEAFRQQNAVTHKETCRRSDFRRDVQKM